MRFIAARDLLDGDPPGEDAAVEGAELTRLYWTLKQREKDLVRRERYWASINDALVNAYEELAGRARELQSLREELERVNAGLETRVTEQVTEILQRASEIDVLSVQLRQKVRDRSRELQLALERTGAPESGPVLLSSGTVVGGRARVLAKLAESATGSVYEAEDLVTNRRVALKLLHTSDRDALARFVAEADAASAVNHPAIVRTLHVDVAEDGTPYQLMELVRGVTLRRFLQSARVRLGDAARIGASVADALAAAHAQGVVHRDIKPENLLLSRESPGVRVLDFGIAKHLAAAGLGEGADPSAIHGTPGYMAPEQIRPVGGATASVDIYSLGVVLFELVAGRRPFVKPRVEDVLVAHLYAPAPALGGPTELAAIVAACLEKQPSARPSAAELREKLAAFADSVEARPADLIGCSAAEIVAAAESAESAAPASSER